MKNNDQNRQLVLENLKRTPIIQFVCEKLCISRATFYRWRNEDKGFAKEVEKAILEGQLLVNDLAESQLIRSIKDRNFSAIAYWLRHHHPDYHNKIELETTVKTVHELSAEQKELVKRALELANITLTHEPKQQQFQKES